MNKPAELTTIYWVGVSGMISGVLLGLSSQNPWFGLPGILFAIGLGGLMLTEGIQDKKKVRLVSIKRMLEEQKKWKKENKKNTFGWKWCVLDS